MEWCNLQGKKFSYKFLPRFTNPNVYVQKDSFGSQVFCRNRRDFVFQIQPKMNFDARKDYRQAVKFYQSNVVSKHGAAAPQNDNHDDKQVDEAQAAAEHQKQVMKQQQELESYKKKLAQLKKKMEDEEDTNLKTVERRRGEFVTYGSEIQIFHVDSESYLCAKKTCADLEKTCNKVELLNKPSQAIYFKILPRYKYRQEGDKIKYGDQIIFLNVKINLYLHVGDHQIPIEEPIKLPLVPGKTKNEITPVIIDRRCPPVNYVPLYEINVSTSFSRFKAVPFCFYDEDDKKYLRGGTVAQLKHSELGGLLSSDDKDFTDDGLAEIFLWKYKGKEADTENFNTQSLFEIELAQDDLKGQIARTSDDKDIKKNHINEHRFRLRHLNTGRLVTAQKITYNGEPVVTLGLAEHINLKPNKPDPDHPDKKGDTYHIEDKQKMKELEESTLFKFITTNPDNDSRIKNYSCVKIYHCQSEQYLTMRPKSLFNVIKRDNLDDKASEMGAGAESKDFQGTLFEPLEDEEINHANRHVIELQEKAGYEDAFFIQILDKESLKDIMFVHTSVGILKKTIPYLCLGSDQIPKERFNQMDQIMKTLDLFSKFEEKTGIDIKIDGDEGSGSQDFDMNTLKDRIIKRQKIMRELYLVEYIVQILYFPFATRSFNLMKIKQEDLITRICQNAYILLKSAVGGYEINEMYASQWINFFFSQAMKTNKENDIFAQSTVEELLSDNQKLLENQITPAIIKQFITLCKVQEKDKKLIKLLTALCTCYGKPVEHNQMNIVKFLLEDKDTRDKLMMPVRMRDAQLVETKIENGQFIPLFTLEDYSQSQDKGRIYKYFKSLVTLGSNLAIGRNPMLFNQLNTLYPFDAVFQVLSNPNYPFDLRSVFLNIMNTMHLDCDPLERLNIPTTTVVMHEIPNFDDLVPSHDHIMYPIRSSRVEIPQNLMKLKDFCLNLLTSQNGVQDLSDKQKNKFVSNIIVSLEFMLTHGFYRNQDELNDLALPMIMLLDGSDDVYEDESGESSSTGRYKYTQKNEIILQSKKIQCDCLIFISQLELDGRSELFLSKIKKEYEQSSERQIDAKGGLNRLRSDEVLDIEALKNNAEEIRALQKQNKYQNEDSSQYVYGQSNVEFLDTIASMKGFEKETGDIYICILFDLLLYSYSDLNYSAFELLIRYFNRKSSLLECLSNMQILETKKSIDILNKVKVFQTQLKIHQSEADHFMNESDKSSKETKLRVAHIFHQLTRFCTVQTHQAEVLNTKVMMTTMSKFFTSKGLKKDIEYENDPNQLTEQQEEFIMFLNLPHNENKENQRLLRSLEIDDFAVFFIKYRTEESDANEPEHIQFMHDCYRFLIKFVRGNIINQSKLKESLDYFLKDLDNHALAINLVYEIFKDNKKFLNLNAGKILRQIINTSEKADMNDSIKGSLYKLMTTFCRFKDKLVRANQQDIVVFLSSKGKQSNILYLFTTEGFKDFNKLIQQQKQVVFPSAEDANLLGGLLSKKTNEEEDPSKSNPTIFVTNPIINIMALVDLLSLCCEGKSDIAEQKCQTEVITLENAYNIILACEYFWPLKRQFVDYVWQCFLDSNSKSIFAHPNEQNIKRVWKISEVILNDMINIVDSFNRFADKEVYVKFPYKTATSLRSESIQFLTDSIFPYFKYMMKRKDIQIDLDGEPIITVFTKQIVNFYYAVGEGDAKKKAFNIIGYIYNKPTLSKYLEGLKHPLIGLHPSKIRHMEIQRQSIEENNTQVLEVVNFSENSESSKLTQILQQLSKSQEVKHMIELEFEELVLWITNIELRINDIVNQSAQYNAESFENLTFASIVSAILQMLDKRELSKQLHLIGLQIIRKLVEVENKNFVTPSADWDTDDYIEFKGQIVAKQDALVEIGAVQFICKHIAEVDDDDILEQCLLIGISLLLGGNGKAQEAFLHYFQEQDEFNKVLNKLKFILMKEFDQSKIYLQEKNAKLVMIAKAQDRQAQIDLRKSMKLAAQEEGGQQADPAKSMIALEQLNQEEEENQASQGNNDFDDTLENLMSVDESNEGASILQEAGDGENDETNIKDGSQSVKKVIRILRFMQLLVEGHFTPLQNHLREQTFSDGNINSKSFDFVASISTMLGVFEKQYVNCYSCEMGYQLMDTLIELIQGPCKENQRTLVSSKVIDNCRDLISQGSSERERRVKGFVDDKLELLDGLKQKSVKLLLSIIEGPIDKDIMKSITISLDDFLVVFERIQQVFFKFVSEDQGLDLETVTMDQIQKSLFKDSLDGEGIQEGFDLFILIKTLADCNPPVQEIITPFQEFPYFQFFQENTAYIEILIDANTMQRVYFPIKPVCRYLQKQSKTNLMISIDRSSPQQKIIGLLRAVPELVDEMTHIEHLSRSTIQITPTRLNIIRDFSTILALVCCALVLAFYEYGLELDESGNYLLGPTADPDVLFGIKILGYIQFCTAIMILIGELITRAHLIIRSSWRHYVEKNRIEFQNLLSKKSEGGEYSSIKAGDLGLNDARLILLTQGPDAPEFSIEESEKKDFGHFLITLEYLWMNLRFILSNGRVLFLIIYASLSLLGLFQSPVFYSMQLLDIINRFPSLTNVVKAITVNKSQLLMTAMLELILIYIYCVLLFTFFFDHYFNDDIQFNENEKGDVICRSLFHCYVSTLNFGLRAGGGIGDQLPSNSYFNETKEVYYLRALNDLSFFMIIIVLFFNIIFGIIIDTFAGLRNEKAEMEEDMRNICFICGIDRQSIDKDSINGYVYHYKKEHNLWAYIYFIIHLNTKDETDYNGTESFIADKLSQDDISWFPFNKAICLELDKYQIQPEK